MPIEMKLAWQKLRCLLHFVAASRYLFEPPGACVSHETVVERFGVRLDCDGLRKSFSAKIEASSVWGLCSLVSPPELYTLDCWIQILRPLPSCA